MKDYSNRRFPIRLSKIGTYLDYLGDDLYDCRLNSGVGPIHLHL